MSPSSEQMATSPQYRPSSNSTAMRVLLCIIGIVAFAAMSLRAFPADSSTNVNPATMLLIGAVISRFQS